MESQQTDVDGRHQTPPRAAWKTILFGFKGRIRRATFWGNFGIIWAVIMVAAVLAYNLAGGDPPNTFLLLWIPMFIAICWVGLATQVKRWHHLDMSGWMVLINIIPYLGALIALVWLGCAKGTDGPNTYGPGPVGWAAAPDRPETRV